MILLIVFLVIVISPCVVAFVGGADAGLGWFGERKEVPRAEPEQAYVEPEGFPQQVMFEETQLADEFRVRSFPKGLAQRRLLLQDRVGEVRLHIRALRQAVWEQMRQAGIALEGYATAAKREAESRAVLLRRLAQEARAAWERSAAMRARAARLEADRRAGWSDAEEYARWRWRERGAEAFEAA